MENNTKRTLRFFVLTVLVLVLLALMGSRGLAASNSLIGKMHEAPYGVIPNGGGGLIGGYPVYDSNWYEIGIRPDDIVVQFDHNLGADPTTYLIELECRDETSLLTYDCSSQDFTVDAHWYNLTNSSISIYVKGGSRPDAIRVRIYAETPAYDSGWADLGIRPDPIPVQFTHNLTGDPDRYLVSLICQDDVLGLYDCVSQNFSLNADWYDLTSTTINVWAGRYLPDAVRVRILVKENPSFDSGWDEIGSRPDPIPLIYQHGLGGDPDIYFVDLTCRDDTSLQIYQCADQGFAINAHWYAVTDTSITLYIIGASQPDYVRVRIWGTVSIFLPLIMR